VDLLASALTPAKRTISLSLAAKRHSCAHEWHSAGAKEDADPSRILRRTTTRTIHICRWRHTAESGCWGREQLLL